MKVAILRDENESSTKKWELACVKEKIDYEVIDLLKHNWIDCINSSNADLFLLRPSGLTFKYKNLYDERLYVISEVMKKKTYPSYQEVIIYENKRMLSAFLKGANISMPETNVFYNIDEAYAFADSCSLPIVVKTAIGGSGTGVLILKHRSAIRNYIKKAFNKGIKRRLGPNRQAGNVKKWTQKSISSPAFFLSKLKKYLEIYKDAQKGFVIFQEYIPHEYEWRIARIGNSWFGHQKVKNGDKASGTKGIDYVSLPSDLLDFCRNICKEHNFTCMSLDLFEHPTKGYVVNELQTIFGHVQNHILELDGKIGRYIYDNGWRFEEGDFNTNESYDLRLKHALSLIEK